MIRQIKLTSKTEQLDLSHQDHYITNISGFGKKNSIKVNVTPSGNSYIESQLNKPPQIKGNISLKDYQTFEKVESFIEKAGSELWIEYTIPTDPALTFKASVVINSLTKTEIGAGNRLSSTITLIRLSRWFVHKATKASNSTDLFLHALYPRLYPYSYVAGLGDKDYFEYIVDGVLPQWVNITLSPTVGKPIIQFVDYDTNKLVKQFKVLQDLKTGFANIVEFKIVATPWNRKAVVVTSDGKEASIVDRLSFDSDNFILLEPGRYQVRMSDEDGDIPEEKTRANFKFDFIEVKGY